ncbi:MAG: hypothetical protein LBK27_00720 [Treponema sp.]|jgi:hypothetical protein|nr:hypothetical protein [Treponema sp.]
MIKKLRLFICFAAVLSFGGQALLAQTSPTAEVTNGRFVTDVDRFSSVNDWADLTMTKWFSYLKMANADSSGVATILLNDDHWEAGAALKLQSVYLGLSYTGTFNNGGHNLGNYTSTAGAPTWDVVNSTGIDMNGATGGYSYSSFSGLLSGTVGINRNNSFGILIGAKDAGWKVTLTESINSMYLPYVVDANGNEGYAMARNGTITPGLEWGAARDMNFGNLSARPKVKVSLAIHYDTDEFVSIGDYTYTDHGNNSITPTVGLDTGGIAVSSGPWGDLKLGADETLAFMIAGDGSGSSSVPWENRIAPYAKFSFTPAGYLGIGAKLRVPVSVGLDGINGFVAVGKVQHSGNYYGLSEDVTSTLDVGIRFAFINGGPLSVITDKLGLSDKLAITGGVKVHLPGYEFNENTSTGARSHAWEGATGRGNDTGGTARQWFQKLSLGFSLNLVPNVMLDCSYDINNAVTGFDNMFANRILSVMLSAKY